MSTDPTSLPHLPVSDAEGRNKILKMRLDGSKDYFVCEECGTCHFYQYQDEPYYYYCCGCGAVYAVEE